jgi:gamma-glutamyltranspeptidase/glutathione hydrolase
MSPTIVFDDDGNVVLVTGSAGGSKIIGDTAQSIWNVIEFDLDPQEAINVPHYQNRNEKTEIESP